MRGCSRCVRDWFHLVFCSKEKNCWRNWMRGKYDNDSIITKVVPQSLSLFHERVLSASCCSLHSSLTCLWRRAVELWCLIVGGSFLNFGLCFLITVLTSSWAIAWLWVTFRNQQGNKVQILFLRLLHPGFWGIRHQKVSLRNNFSTHHSCKTAAFICNNLDSILSNSVILHTNAKGEYNATRSVRWYLSYTFTLPLKGNKW